MGTKYGCEKAQKEMLACDTQSKELAHHLEQCEECRKKYQELLKMKSAVLMAAPKTPDLRSGVMARIVNENIEIKQPCAPRRRFIPFGTIAAAAAVFVIYLSVQSSGVSDMLSPKNENQLINDTDSAENVVITDSETVAKAGAKFRYFAFDQKGSDSAISESSAEPESAPALYSAAPEGMEFSKNDVLLAKPKRAQDLDKAADKLEAGAVKTETSAEKLEAVADNVNAPMLDTAQKTASEWFEEYDRLYPGRISRELFEKAGNDAYISFISSITDFELQYTAISFEEFLNK